MNSIKNLTLNQVRFWEAELLYQQAAGDEEGVRHALDKLYVLPVEFYQMDHSDAMETVRVFLRSKCAPVRAAAVAVLSKWRNLYVFSDEDEDADEADAEDTEDEASDEEDELEVAAGGEEEEVEDFGEYEDYEYEPAEDEEDFEGDDELKEVRCRGR